MLKLFAYVYSYIKMEKRVRVFVIYLKDAILKFYNHGQLGNELDINLTSACNTIASIVFKV